jgi:DNA polymerase
VPVLDIDIETYSEVELKKANVYAYVEDPSFQIIMCGWSLDGSPVEVWDSYEEFQDRLREIPGLWDPDVTKVAHNAGFERVCFSAYAGLPVGEYLPPEHWFDTAALAAQKGLPRSLDSLARAVRVDPKDSAGTRLINLFSKPYRGRRVMPEERPDEWADFRRYCGQDVSTMQQARPMLKGWPRDGFERRVWNLDQRINDRGMRVDLDLASKARALAHANTEDLSRRVTRDTGIENPNSTAQMLEWLRDNGCPGMPNLRATTVSEYLEMSSTPPAARAVLEAREELALVAHRKFEAALRGASSDGRLRGQFVYHGAHTGRWAAKGVQVHNMPRLAFTNEVTGDYDEDWEECALRAILAGLPQSQENLKRAVRPLFTGPIATSDFSAIEARVLAWLAGEGWVAEAFRRDEDIYVTTAERMGGMTRQQGKIAVLASGYQGSAGTYRKMGYGGRRCPCDVKVQKAVVVADGPNAGKWIPEDNRFDAGKVIAEMPDDGLGDVCQEAFQEHLGRIERKAKREGWTLAEQRATIATDLAEHTAERRRSGGTHRCDTQIMEVVNAWRAANENIVAFWYDLQKKFWTGGRVGEHLSVEVHGSWRVIVLPSRRRLMYRNVKRYKKTKVVDEETGEKAERWVLEYTTGVGKPEETYGGKLAENVTQAVARDMLADAMLRLEDEGYLLVGHVHDEAIADADDLDQERLNRMRQIMRTPPEWAADMPMDASIAVLKRYRKD